MKETVVFLRIQGTSHLHKDCGFSPVRGAGRVSHFNEKSLLLIVTYDFV